MSGERYYSGLECIMLFSQANEAPGVTMTLDWVYGYDGRSTGIPVSTSLCLSYDDATVIKQQHTSYPT